MPPPLTILGIETSCDDTAAAVVQWQAENEQDSPCAAQSRILSNEIWAQHEDHKSFGGIVPEIAARSHVERIDGIIEKAMDNAGVHYDQLDAIAATAGPGLIGGVLVGLTTAKAIALSHDKPLIPINHLEGHALSVRMTEHTPYPYLLLLISGGHTQLVQVNSLGDYLRVGTTIDDAAGEAFDKTAKLLGLGQPGGPRIEAISKDADSSRFPLPEPLKNKPGCDFSLSGLKTAVRLRSEALSNPSAADIADLAASFQAAIAAHLAARTSRAMALPILQQSDRTSSHPRLVVAGGVAANSKIRSALALACHNQGWEMIVPEPKYCTDNGAMIAWAGLERFVNGKIPAFEETMGTPPRARWPLAPPPLGSEFGSGKKGPKA